MPIVPDTTDPDMTVKRFIEPKTGKTHALYYYKRKLMPQRVLPGQRSEQLAGYVLIEKDLQNARRWLERATGLIKPETLDTRQKYVSGTDRDTYDLAKGLFVAAVTFYAKCFTRCDGRRAQLSKTNLSQNLRDVHELFMLFRNNFAAHSGAERLEHAKAILLLHPKMRKSIEPRIVVDRVQPDFILMKGGDPGLPELIDEALAIVNDRHDKLTAKIMEEEILPRGPEYWYRRAK